jgi:hypothetical protein
MRKIKLLTPLNAISLTPRLFNRSSANQRVNDDDDDDDDDDDSVYLLISLVTAKRQLQTSTDERKMH